MEHEIANFTKVNYEGNNPLVRKVLALYERVINDKAPLLRATGESKALAVSGSALYDLGASLLESFVQREIRADALGVKDAEIDGARAHLYDAVSFICIEVLERWYGALKRKGLEAENLSAAADSIRSGKVATTNEVIQLVNGLVEHASALLDIKDIRPQNGFAHIDEQLEFERLVGEKIIRIGVYL